MPVLEDPRRGILYSKADSAWEETEVLDDPGWKQRGRKWLLAVISMCLASQDSALLLSAGCRAEVNYLRSKYNHFKHLSGDLRTESGGLWVHEGLKEWDTTEHLASTTFTM